MSDLYDLWPAPTPTPKDNDEPNNLRFVRILCSRCGRSEASSSGFCLDCKRVHHAIKCWKKEHES